MTRSALRRRIRERRRRQRREFLLVLIGFALLLGAWLWYYFIYTRTPDYSIKQLAAGIERRDTSVLARYIDLDQTLDQAYDAFTAELFLYDTALTEETRDAYLKFYNDIKPQLIQGVSDTIQRRVASGEWLLPDGAALTKGRQLGIDFEHFLERSRLRATEIIAIDSFKVIDQQAHANMLIRDRHTGIEFTLTLHLKQAADGHWQITQLPNYRQYLEAIAPRQSRDIADYVAATRDIIVAGNARLSHLQDRFQNIAEGAGGPLTGSSAAAMKALIADEILPTLKERQQQLDTVDIPLGAQYLANLRHTSTQLAIASWQHYQRGLETQSAEAFNTAETLKKQELEAELRITDIIRHNIISQTLPDIP